MKFAILALVIFLVAGTNACNVVSHSDCTDKPFNEVKSPDGKHVAIFFHRSCVNGALYTWVSLQEITRVFAESEPILNVEGLHEISATWTDSNHLEISSEALQHPESVRTKVTGWHNIAIAYK